MRRCPLLATFLMATAPAVAHAAAPTLVFGPATAPASDAMIVLPQGQVGSTGEAKPAESWFTQNGYINVRNVSQATLQPFLPPAHLATGDAVIVAPGGGFRGLAIENEGWVVARALAERGIAAFVLKYRVLPTAATAAEFERELRLAMTGGKTRFPPPADTPADARDDALAALRHVRANADAFNIDPARVGMMGFSAGGFLTLTAALELDQADSPAFIAPIYPTMISRKVRAGAPPMFVAIASDDFLMGDGSLGLVRSWRDAQRPVELHLYRSGGHGFGLGRPNTTTGGWFDSFVRWLEMDRHLSRDTAQSVRNPSKDSGQ